jgi:tryptophanyl-tRNA synthetase
MAVVDQPAAGGTRRLVSGIRPSGALHLGQYVGVLRQWLRYQDDHECFFIIADVQALTTHREQPQVIFDSVREVALDWLAAGIDPERNSFVVQSQIPELMELTVYLQLLVQTGELRSNPTMRNEARQFGEGDLGEKLNRINFGFLGYPIAQVADILAFTTSPPGENDRLIVPVGQDQVPHVEFARDVARRFNAAYGDVFLEPEAKTAPVARLPGTDGGFKMGKSRRNTILLKEPEDEYAPKLRGMFTDPLRVSRDDPGHPDGCPCFLYHQAFADDPAEVDRRHEDCERGRTDCSACAEELVTTVRDVLAPIQARREQYERQPDFVGDVLSDGTARAATVVEKTIAAVREAMNLTYPGLLGKAT